MKIKNLLLFLLTFLFLILETANSETKSPFVWLAEKGGEVSYILGAIHVGVSLEEMPCSSEIVNQIQNSDLLFLEYQYGDDTEKLDREEMKKIFIGSKEEQEEILSRLSFDSQEMIRERKIGLDNFLRSMYPFNVHSVTEDAFSELSPESQEFLIKHGVDPEGSHADFFHFIRFVVYNRAYFSLPSLDEQVEEIAFSQSIEIKALDNNKQINKDIQSQVPSSKPLELVDYTTIEQLIDRVDILVYLKRRKWSQFGFAYKSYDIDLFEDLLREMEKDSKSINEEVFLRDRNESWLSKLVKAHAEYESIFLVAGVRHFFSPHSMLDMLRDQGFSVERMTCH